MDTIIPDIFYDRMDEMFNKLGVQLEDTNDIEKIKNADNFIATFTPDLEPIIIE